MSNKIEISYTQARLTRRLFSRIVDGLLTLLISMLCFLSINQIYNTIPKYQNTKANLDEIRLNSGLYVKSNNQVMNVSTYIYNDKKMSDSQKETYLLNSLDKFFNYLKNYNEESYNKVKSNYEEFLISNSLKYNNFPYFIKENNQIVKNTSANIPISAYINNVYVVYIDTNSNGYLSTEIKEYYSGLKYLNDLTFFVNIPISVFLGSFIVFFIPPFIFKRGRKTIGMLIYHIGFVNKNLYNLSIKEYLLKFVIFYFLEFLLSFFTFGIPLLISLTMMLVTKKKQNFNEYLLNIQEVSTSDSTIYRDKSEIIVESNNASNHVDFKLK